ncbi:hypothetical protein [Brassicibacter mesophilus]|uniref:hypothetical protein n=1 Tax=Brassicibacter mesophilus TaxID=745119 RepID=UPI003D1C7BEB
MDKGRKLIIFLLAAILVLNIYQNAKISELKNDLRNQRYSFNRINEDINQINGDVYDTLNEWERENRWIRDSGYEIKSISDDLQDMTISVFWDFNSLKNDEKVYLNIGKLTDNRLGDTSWEKIVVEPVSDLHYEKQLTLPFEASYTINVLAENNSGKRSEELTKVDIYDGLMDRIRVDGRTGTTGSKVYLDIHLFNPNIGLDLFNGGRSTKSMPEQLKMHKAELQIYVKGKLLETVDLLKEGDYDDDYNDETIDYYKPFEDPDFEEKDLKAIIRVKDNLGLEYEREVELDKDK